MRIAIEGCSHGSLDQIYASVRAIDRRDGKRTELVILCGDVQTLRNQADLHCLAVPDKYKQMGDFHRYYADAPGCGSLSLTEGGGASSSQENGIGESAKTKRVAPYLTIMIGGNHEASNYLWELYYGGWVAPNMYFLGAAGCIEVGGLVIAGVSGIYKSHDFTLGRHERMPYNAGSIRSIYHTRCFDTFRLHMLARQRRYRCAQHKGEDATPAIVLSHDWPNTIEQHGNTQRLLQRKPFFREEVQSETLGSPPLYALLCDLRPAYWFSAHLHVRFAAIVREKPKQVPDITSSNGVSDFAVPASQAPEASTENAEEMDISIHDDEDASEGAPTASGNPDEIVVNDDDDDDDELEAPRHEGQEIHCATNIGAASNEEDGMPNAQETRFLALSKCLEGQDFLQILDIQAPCDADDSYRTHVRVYPAPEASEKDTAHPFSFQPAMRFHEPWLAVLRASDPFLSLEKRQAPLPTLDDASFLEQISTQRQWIAELGTKVVAMPRADSTGFLGDDDTHPMAIRHVQRFVQTAPAANTPQGADFGPPPWYTNPQTVALCDFIGIKNRINAPPEGNHAAENAPPRFAHPPPQVPMLAMGGESVMSEEEEIRRIEAAAQAAMDRKAAAAILNADTDAGIDNASSRQTYTPLVTLDDDEEDEQAARWKEGTG